MSNTFKLNDIKRVVAYGCSYTAGNELADADSIPHLTLEEVNAEKKTLGPTKFYTKYNFSSDRTKLEHERAWPKHLINYLKMPLDYLNRAVGGSSMGEISFAIESDLYNGIINDDDLIVVGVTSLDRILRIRDDGSATSMILHDLDTRWPSSELRKLYTMELANDYLLLYNWYHEVKYIDMLSKTINNRIIQVYLHSDYTSYKNMLNVNSNEFLNIIDSLENIDSVLDKDLSFYKVEPHWNAETEHGFHHPYEIIHKNLAKIIAEKIKEKFI